MVRQDKSRSRVTPKGTTSTAPAGTTGSGVSRTPVKIGSRRVQSLVPYLMFGLMGLGLAVILVNYVFFDPASTWWLLAGLGLILAGIVTATQYR